MTKIVLFIFDLIRFETLLCESFEFSHTQVGYRLAIGIDGAWGTNNVSSCDLTVAYS